MSEALPSTSTLVFVVPVRTGGGLNEREHWALRKKRVGRERWMVQLTWMRLRLAEKAPLSPWHIHLVRLSPGHVRMDDDNVVGALKAIRDQVAEQLHVNDGDRATVAWSYDQEINAKEFAVRVEISTRRE